MKKRRTGTMQTGTAAVLCCACLGLGFALGSLFSSRSAVQAPPPQAVPAPVQSRQAEQGQEIARLQANALASPRDAAAWIQLGNACYDNGDPDCAIDAYSRGLALDPANADVRTDMGTMYRERGQYGKAIECYEEALVHVPLHKNAVLNKGVVLLTDLGQVSEALAFLKGVLAENPGFTLSNGRQLADFLPEFCADAAEHLEQKGKPDKALLACDEALKMNERYLPALLRKAWLLEKTGRAGDARPVWENALKIKPDALDPAGVPVRSRIAEKE